MYTLLQAISVRQLLLAQLPALFASLLVAELFYKFHSFTLETAAFLATWFVLDAAFTSIGRLAARRSHRQ